MPGQVREEGPFGEWMGYYSDDTVARPYLDVKTILHRNDPILTCAPQHKPVDETGLLKGIAGAAQIWRALEACGIPDILGVWNHEAGPGDALHRDPDQAALSRPRAQRAARRVLLPGRRLCRASGRWWWTRTSTPAISTRCCGRCARGSIPMTDIDTVQKAWASKRDPLYLPGNFNNRILIDACIPYDKLLKGTFPPVVDVSPGLRQKMKAKFPQLFSEERHESRRTRCRSDCASEPWSRRC